MSMRLIEALIFALAIGAIGGWLSVRKQTDKGWVIAMIPYSFAFVGIPIAALFWLAESSAADAILGWAGTWRVAFVSLLLAWAFLIWARRSRRMRIRNSGDVLAAVISFVGGGFLSLFPALLWLGVGWAIGAETLAGLVLVTARS